MEHHFCLTNSQSSELKTEYTWHKSVCGDINSPTLLVKEKSDKTFTKAIWQYLLSH